MSLEYRTAKALDLVERALRVIGVLQRGESIDADETEACLTALNDMLDSESLDNLTIYQNNPYTFTLNKQQSITVGDDPSADIITPSRPIDLDRIDPGTITIGTRDYPLEYVTLSEYNAVQVKNSVVSWPQYVIFDDRTPIPQVIFFPQVSGTLKLNVNMPLQIFSSLTDSIVLPPGYREWITYALAIRLHAEYPEFPLEQQVIALERQAKARIKRQNNKSEPQVVDASWTLGIEGLRDGRFVIRGY